MSLGMSRLTKIAIVLGVGSFAGAIFYSPAGNQWRGDRGFLGNSASVVPAASAQAPAAQAGDDKTVIKQDVNLVSIYFTVRDNHKQLISSLTQDQFRVT